MVEIVTGTNKWPNEISFRDTRYEHTLRAVPYIQGDYHIEVQDTENPNVWHFIDKHKGDALSMLRMFSRHPEILDAFIQEGRKEITSLDGQFAPRWDREPAYAD